MSVFQQEHDPIQSDRGHISAGLYWTNLKLICVFRYFIKPCPYLLLCFSIKQSSCLILKTVISHHRPTLCTLCQTMRTQRWVTLCFWNWLLHLRSTTGSFQVEAVGWTYWESSFSRPLWVRKRISLDQPTFSLGLVEILLFDQLKVKFPTFCS